MSKISDSEEIRKTRKSGYLTDEEINQERLLLLKKLQFLKKELNETQPDELKEKKDLKNYIEKLENLSDGDYRKKITLRKKKLKKDEPEYLR